MKFVTEKEEENIRLSIMIESSGEALILANGVSIARFTRDGILLLMCGCKTEREKLGFKVTGTGEIETR